MLFRSILLSPSRIQKQSLLRKCLPHQIRPQKRKHQKAKATATTLLNKFSKLLTLLFFLLSLGADISSKSLAKSQLTPGEHYPAIPGLINFCLTSNTGGAFSFGQNNFLMISSAATALTLAIIFWWLKKEFKGPLPTSVERAAIGFLLGGAIGNLIDRYRYGKVTDFIEFALINFPIFNVADISIDIGIVLLYIALWQKHKQEKQKLQNE